MIDPSSDGEFWRQQLDEVQQLDLRSENDFKKHNDLPLARIKRIMKADGDVRMVSGEAPVLFAKACEFFVMDITRRAWICSDMNKRRNLQVEDVLYAIEKTDVFDFLSAVYQEKAKAGTGPLAIPAIQTALNTMMGNNPSGLTMQSDPLQVQSIAAPLPATTHSGHPTSISHSHSHSHSHSTHSIHSSISAPVVQSLPIPYTPTTPPLSSISPISTSVSIPQTSTPVLQTSTQSVMQTAPTSTPTPLTLTAPTSTPTPTPTSTSTPTSTQDSAKATSSSTQPTQVKSSQTPTHQGQQVIMPSSGGNPGHSIIVPPGAQVAMIANPSNPSQLIPVLYFANQPSGNQFFQIGPAPISTPVSGVASSQTHVQTAKTITSTTQEDI